MPAAYIPVLIFALLVLSFPVISLIVFKFIRPESRVGDAKFLPYECGIPPESNARGRYSARFYIVAMLFVIFDVETMFLFPSRWSPCSCFSGSCWSATFGYTKRAPSTGPDPHFHLSVLRLIDCPYLVC